MGDFDGDGRQEIATVLPHRLEIGRLANGTFTPVSQMELGVGRKVVRVDEADLDGNGRAELFLTTVVNGELQSLVVDARSGTPTVRWENLPWFFGTVNIPGEGKVLFGQAMGTGEDDFSGNPFRVVLQGKELAAGASLELPWKVDLYGISLLQPAEGQKLIADFNIFDQLKVMHFSGEEIWQSSDPLGGGEAFIERQDNGKSQVNGSATRHLFLPARLAHGLEGELLVPVNEGVRAFSRLREFKESRLQGMKWNGFALEEVWHTRPQEAYLADFRLADADNDGQLEIVQALVFSHKGFLSKGRSAVAVFEIQ